MFRLEPGLRVVNAPRFHIERSLSDRLCVNSGVMVEADRIVPRDDWRPLSRDEAALVIGVDGDDGLAIFNISERLRAEWWTLADSSAGPALENTAFQQYAGTVLDYLHFKQLRLPSTCAVEAVIHAPGQRSTWPGQAGLTAERLGRNERAIVNLGDEESFLAFLNLGQPRLGFPLRERARDFLTEHPEYPIIRLSIWPGEGCWLPDRPMIFDQDTRCRKEIDVQLVLYSDSNTNEHSS